MGNLSDYGELKILDHLTGETTWTKPTVYIGLWCAVLTDSSTGTTAGEPSGGSYSRLATSGLWNASSDGEITNKVMTFPSATGNWGLISHFALTDASGTGTGNIIAWGELNEYENVQAGDTFVFVAGDFNISLD